MPERRLGELVWGNPSASSSLLPLTIRLRQNCLLGVTRNRTLDLLAPENSTLVSMAIDLASNLSQKDLCIETLLK